MSKVSVDNPSVIYELRDSGKCWEGDIKYYQSFLYDKKYVVGTWYEVDNDNIIESSIIFRNFLIRNTKSSISVALKALLSESILTVCLIFLNRSLGRAPILSEGLSDNFKCGNLNSISRLRTFNES